MANGSRMDSLTGATTDSLDQKVEDVKQHSRMASGAYIDGGEYKAKGSATMAKANSDHGSLNKSSIEKSNA